MGGRKCKFFSECKNDAVYKLPHANLRLCKDHFMENVEKRVKKFIKKKHLIYPWDPKYSRFKEKILIAMSGGKDSQVLLHILKKIFPDEHMEGLYIELGIKHNNYSSDSGKIAAATCEKYDIPFHVINTETEYGFTIDNISELKKIFHENDWNLGNTHFKGQCSYCGMIKRYSINKFAHDNGFTCVATGHNLTDETTSLAVNFFNQKMLFLSRMDYKSDAKIEKLVPRIKPLYYITEEEIIMYAYYAKIDHLPTECIYSTQAKNLDIKDILSDIEDYRRGTMIALMRRYQKVLKPILKEYVDENKDKKSSYCDTCGYPTLSKRCYFCRSLNFLRDRFRQASNELDVDFLSKS